MVQVDRPIGGQWQLQSAKELLDGLFQSIATCLLIDTVEAIGLAIGTARDIARALDLCCKSQ
jgi:hypothetical protein